MQQLNFYSFRKIKFNDSIRIDLETEKRTANYWRFRHEHFRRGRPDLLIHIKRMTGKGSSSAIRITSKNPTAVASSAVASLPVPASSNVDKSEVLSLKIRLEEMSKSMDALTEMVQKVSLQKTDQASPSYDYDVEPGMKRKKIVLPKEQQVAKESSPEGVGSSNGMSMDLNDLDVLPIAVGSLEIPTVTATCASPETSANSNDFVDQLFNAFDDDDGLIIGASEYEEPYLFDDFSVNSKLNNRPDPELMKRLSDALELLPKITQEIIVDRLISAITSTDFTDKTPEQNKAAIAGRIPTSQSNKPEQSTMPLAAVTLAALLHHYTNQIKEISSTAGSQKLEKSIPVIPVHA